MTNLGFAQRERQVRASNYGKSVLPLKQRNKTLMKPALLRLESMTTPP